jgi:GNAT superfamily N-acetyltransferase
MRIHHYRPRDLATLVHLTQLAAQVDGTEVQSEAELTAWLSDPELDPTANIFVVRDDDDELNAWSQAGTLDGLEGEIIAYIVLQLEQRDNAYHFVCRGVVHPEHRGQHAGRILIVGALNRARMIAAEFEAEAERAGHPIYFDILFAVHDPAVPHLAAKCEMHATEEPAPPGFRLYRRELW